jgi:hypothetical protein
MTTYKNWYYHGEKPVWCHVVPNLTPMSTNAGRSIEHGENMHTILRDVFGMHDVRVDDCDSQVIV